MADIVELARWTKLAGTDTELESLKYFDRQLAGLGFTTQTILHPAYISLPGTARLEFDGQPMECITHSFSRQSGSEGIEGELVHVGRGHAADYAGIDVRGKIVVIDGIATPEVSRFASDAGAVGQLHISPHQQRYEMCISPVWGSPGIDDLDDLPTTVVVTVSGDLRETIIDRISKGGAGARLFAEVDTAWRPTPILVADMASPAAAADEPFVLFSGHHDTWYYGVMDNGGANATMLEVARVAVAERAQWRRGLRLCFWSGHSQGRYSGSAWYADEHWDELERRCVAHVNVDSTGGLGAVDLSETASMSLLHQLASDAVSTHAKQAYVGKRRGRSGDDSFGGIGIASMFGPVSEQPKGDTNGRRNLGWWWHTPEDLADKIDPDLLVRDTQVVGHAVWHLLIDDVLPIDVEAQLQDLHRQLGPLLASGLATELVAPIVDAAATMASAVQTTRAAPPAALNAAILRACRILVPVDYTSGDRFAHEPALPSPAWPSLEPLRRYAKSADDEHVPFLRVDAVRARNRLLKALREATAEFAALAGNVAP